MSPAQQRRRRLALSVLALAAAGTFIAASAATHTINGLQLLAAAVAIFAVLTLANDELTDPVEVTR